MVPVSLLSETKYISHLDAGTAEETQSLHRWND